MTPRTRRQPYEAGYADLGPGGRGHGIGGRVRFEDKRLARLGFTSVDLVWGQAGSRFVLQELVIRGTDLSPWQCRRLPLEQLLHDAATHLPRSMKAVEVDGQWQDGAVAAAMLRSASLAARRGRSDHVVERNEAFLRRHETGETYAQLADSADRDISVIGKWLRAAKDERERMADEQQYATGGHRKLTPS
ncbi:MAG: hypothetical protein ACYDCS_04080 [Candidatus Dormibacteria bacterium]